jgi:uncharacterized membrane protein (DUF2068 family)
MIAARAPLSIRALAIFFAFGATMSGLTAFLLLFPGTFLDAAWRINPEARAALQPLGLPAVVLMVSVCLACVTASVGLWRVRVWGYWIAIAILSVNLLGDTLNFIFLHDWRTLIGLPIGGAMIAYLISGRDQFS